MDCICKQLKSPALLSKTLTKKANDKQLSDQGLKNNSEEQSDSRNNLDRRPERSSMRRHKSSTTINNSGDDQRPHQESFQRRWSFRLPHSASPPSSSSWTALKIP